MEELSQGAPAYHNETILALIDYLEILANLEVISAKEAKYNYV